MIDLLFFFFGFLLILFDISFFPALTDYKLISDLLLFFSFSIYDLKKVNGVPIFMILLLLKSVFVPKEILLLFILIQLVSFLFFISLYHTILISKYLLFVICGSMSLLFESILLKRKIFPDFLLIIFIQIFFCTLFLPLFNLLKYYYLEKIKRKGVFV